LRGWAKQAQIDLEDGIGFLRGGARPPIATLVRFIEEHRHDRFTTTSSGTDGGEFGVELICRVPSEHGCPIAPSTSMSTDLVLGALEMGIWHRGRLAEAGVRPSIGSVGDSYDIAMFESVPGAVHLSPHRRRNA
jgi:transposase InsO family protein